MKLNPKYLIAGVIIFLIEVVIALFVNDSFIRPYVGDVLVVILIYTLIKGLTQRPTKRLPIYVVIFAVCVEVLQLFRFIEWFGLENNMLARVVFGSTFDIKDILCYAVGGLLLLEWERLLRKDISYL